MQNKLNPQKVIPYFIKDAEVLNCDKFGNGHINGTYLALCRVDGEYHYFVLQHINKNVFKNPKEVMHNIDIVTKFIAQKDESATLQFIRSEKGTLCFEDEQGENWRMYRYIDNAVGIDRPTLEEFYESGVAFGRFQSLLSDFPADTLYETIKDFHNTPQRYRNLIAAVENNLSGRLDTCLSEVEFAKARKDFCSVLLDSNKNGILPLRVSHNDTKCNNALLDIKTHKAVCVIDLDTIMPGFSVTDFGDAIRFGANTAAEDEKDLSKVNLDMEKFTAYTKGFIEGCGGRLPKEEMELLPEGAIMMTLECGMRFLTDYLDGDTYFKTAYPEHNLVRARTQFKLVKAMEAHLKEMKATVKGFMGE